MSVTPGKIKFTYNGRLSGTGSFEISRPLFGYTTAIEMTPLMIKVMPDGNIYTKDLGAGSDYDTRYCRCDFILTEAEMALFDSKMFESEARGQELIMEIDGDGFYPFGADKGDAGQFTVAVKVVGETSRLKSPLYRYSLSLEIYNVGDYPAYTLPTETGAGPVSLAGITDLRYPDTFPQAKISRTDDLLIVGGTTAFINSRDSYTNNPAYTDIKKADNLGVVMGFRLNQTKMAKLLDKITQDVRAAQFTFSCGSGTYPFGYEAGSGVHNCLLLENKITVSHDKFNEFKASLTIGKLHD